MSVIDISIGQKYYQIDCDPELAPKITQFSVQLNMLINTKAMELGTRVVGNDYLLLLVCLDLLMNERNSVPEVAETPAVTTDVSQSVSMETINPSQQKIIQQLLQDLTRHMQENIPIDNV